MQWQWRNFDALTVRQLYELLQLRQQVFIVEQTCPYGDIDGWDPVASHLLGTNEQQRIVACCRVLSPGDRFAEASIGRLLTAADQRGRGLGHTLVRLASAFCREHFADTTVRICAQAHLKGFYGQHGYQPEGAAYDVDGIPHQDLLWNPAGMRSAAN